MDCTDMEISRKSCRLCLSETEFNVSLFGSYCQRTNMIDKIMVCLKLVIENSDYLNTICYRCADSVERYYKFINDTKKHQTWYRDKNWHEPPTYDHLPKQVNMHVKSYVREEMYDADYTFSFLEVPNEEKEKKVSSPLFSYLSPPNVVIKQSKEPAWKAPKSESIHDYKPKKQVSKAKKTHRHHSRDLFDSESQDVDEAEPKILDWKLTPDDSIIKRIREKCFGRRPDF